MAFSACRNGVRAAVLEEALICLHVSGRSRICFSVVSFIRNGLSRSERRLSGEHWWISPVAHDKNLQRTELMLSWVSLTPCPLCSAVLEPCSYLRFITSRTDCSALKLQSSKGPAKLSLWQQAGDDSRILRGQR